MNYKLLMRLGILLIAIFTTTSMSFAQGIGPGSCDNVQDMGVTVDNASYTPYTGSYNTRFSNTTSYWSYYTVNLPFQFCFDQRMYTQVEYGGAFQLGFKPYPPGALTYIYYFYANGYYSYPNDNWSLKGIGNYQKNYVSAWGGEPYYWYAPANRDYGYKLLGSSPNRIAVFEWYRNIYHWNASNLVTLQIKLYETTNKIELHYDQVTCGYTWYFDYYFSDPPPTYQYWYMAPLIAVVGKDGTPRTGPSDWLNVYPPGAAGNSNWTDYRSSIHGRGTGLPATTDGVVGDGGPLGPFPAVRKASIVNSVWAQSGVRITFGKGDPKIINSVPTAKTVLRKGSVYGGSGDEENKPAVWVERDGGMPTVKILYRIYGPGLETQGATVIYRAKDAVDGSFQVNPNPQPAGDSVKVDFTVGTGIAFGTGGTLDLLTNNANIKPGEYYVDAAILIDKLGQIDYAQQKFNISLPNDIALFVYKPKRKADKKYPLAATPIEMEIRNFGINAATSFDVFAIVYKDGQRISDTLKYSWSGTLDPASSVIINNFPFFYPNAVGDYEIRAWVVMTSATDQDLTSNIVPRSDEPAYIFAIVKEVDIRAITIVKPNASNPVTVGRPMIPVARFTNQGVNDLDYNTIYFWVTNSANDVVYRDTIKNYVISAGARFDTTDVAAMKFFVATAAGNYTMHANIVAPYCDNPASWKYVTASFYADPGISGDITVGQSGTYKTIQEVVAAMYIKGVAGNVRLLLTDKSYTVGDTIMINNPALDLTAHIPGIGPNATVTFMPSPDRAAERGSTTSGVTINVLTGSGIGILMGQSINPYNPAIVNFVTPSSKSKYANSAGYFIFNGGQNKSIRFVLTTPRNSELYFHNVFHLQQGSQNNQIKNCLFENNYKNADGTKREPHVYIPKTKIAFGSQVYHMANKEKPTTGLSSAILMRGVPPIDETGTNGQYNLDTITINNNIIEGNEISGFGYGIVDLGTGPLLREQHAKWVKYYNSGNVFKNNMIKEVGRAGIFLGFTDGEVVEGNRIFNVTGEGVKTFMSGMTPFFPEVAGIMAGGDVETGWFGYNNVNLTIKGNEISNVKGEWVCYGIKSEQVKNQYAAAAFFPDVKENTKVFNNIIWDMTAKNNDPSISRIGIRLFTERTSLSNILVPKDPAYFTWDDRVFSNTVILADDGGSTTGALAGIAVQHSKSPMIMNNAVAIEDVLIHTSSPAAALIFFQGILPTEGHGLRSDRNAFFRKNANDVNGPAVYGFVELNAEGEFIEPLNPGLYDQDGYQRLRQWRNWTGEDMNSVFGDFRDDLTVVGSTTKYLRIKNPRPFGSILNDRGFRLHELLNDQTSMYQYDAFGLGRGVNGQLYDIGAEEFEGRMYLSDIEFVMVSSPAAYQAGSGVNSDAEYIMTTLPLQFKVILRNSGNLFQAGVKVRLAFENIDFDDGVKYYDTVETDIVVSQSREVIFDIPNSLIRTYSDLEDAGLNPVVPTRFNPSMKPNVTPRYQFSIEVQSDEKNVNNYDTTVIRFYVRKSNTKFMLISGEHTNADIFNLFGPVRSTDELAGRLNYRELTEAFEAIGWWPRIRRDVDLPGSDLDSSKIDVFDRLAWEPKAVDYTMYKYLFWSDRDDNDASMNRNYINRLQQWDIADFVAAGELNNKRNLVIASQEAVRNLDYATTHPNYDDKSTIFVNDHLRAMMNGNGYAFGSGIDCHGQFIKGVAVGRDILHLISRTGESFNYGGTIVNDEPPYLGTCNLFRDGEGLAASSFDYPGATSGMQTSGIATTTLRKNVIYMGVDWRHMANVENVLRAILDYYDKNGGSEIPVELENFDAKANGNRVEISWATASEFNTAKFEVEKATISEHGLKGDFAKIATKSAAGTSANRIEYGPIVDKNVNNSSSYIYRLKMIDLDGKYEYSDEKLVEFNGLGFWLGDAQPNPVNGDVVKFQINTGDRNIDVLVYDVNGRKVDVSYVINPEGLLEVSLNMIPSGNYTMLVKSADLTMTRQFQVTK